MRLHVIDGKFVFEGPYVDTMVVYHSDTLKMLNMRFPSRELEPRQYMNIITLTYAPFSAFTTEPRPNLAAQMVLQGMNSLPVMGDATLKSLGEQEPLVMTTSWTPSGGRRRTTAGSRSRASTWSWPSSTARSTWRTRARSPARTPTRATSPGWARSTTRC
ncbi:hypothetical protein VTN96DRAFT_7094 [Rasamsonia emersonii]